MKTKILLTGATGLIGSCIAVELLENTRGCEPLFLVRAAGKAQGVERVRAALAKVGARAITLAGIEESQIILGDLGASAKLADDARLQDVTHVINCAAVTAFSNRPSIKKVNVDDTLAFAGVIAGLPAVRRFVYVGTAMICGAKAVNRVVCEDESPAPTTHFVPYTESKAAAEALLPGVLGQVPLTVVRPSIIVGHSRLGCKPSTSIFWIFRMLYLAWRSPFPLDYKIDVLPADYAARAIVFLTLKDELAHPRYHIAAGPAASCTFGEILDTFGKNGGRQAAPPLKVTIRHYAENLASFNAWFGPGNPRLMLRAINLYYNFANLSLTFDNARLLAEGFEPPPRFIDYLGLCIKTGCHDPVSQQMIDDFK
ncbi:SDR family oxidoreductase [Anaeroselena agilis]|uniref:SDR family oxidoreductase n=1 Tax=Anaeroselena agilis TaxID=3063788 RepID=A0ABU3P0N8_9FIRM|nr:SDR family oxidoreductase [Selenomonadales bacterium 4137-cl]